MGRPVELPSGGSIEKMKKHSILNHAQSLPGTRFGAQREVE